MKTADMTSVPPVRSLFQKQKFQQSILFIIHTLFSLFLSRTVLTVEESQSCHVSSTTESYFKMD